MELWTNFYFYACAAMAVIGALATVLMPNPIRGAMGLLLMILSLAGLFLALHAEFLAAIQLIVYAGAIVVLFLFVIMLLGPDATPPHDSRGRFSRTLAGALFALTALGAMAAVVHVGLPYGPTHPEADFGSIDQFGRVRFSYGVVPFELSSALLMVAVLGAVAVARGKDAGRATVANAGGAKRSILHGATLDSPAAPLSPHIPSGGE